MSNNTATVLDSVLSGMVASYTATEVPVVAVRKARTVKAKPGQVRIVKGAAVSAPTTIPLPAVGSLDAAGFILALRNAGQIEKKNEAGITVKLHDANKSRLDQIQAIAAFVGYDYQIPLGTQLDRARQKAQFILRPVKTESRVAATVAGYVAGMPNGTEKVVMDLQARIKMAEDTIAELEKAAEFSTDGTVKATKMALATVESERIAHMRRDLALITG